MLDRRHLEGDDPALSTAGGTGPLARLLTDEGHTGGGLSAVDSEQIVRTVRGEVSTRHLTESVYWGKEIDDERYLLVSRM